MKENLKLNQVKYQNIQHKVVNFVNDNNSMICFDDENYTNPYLNQYFKVLKYYYTLNEHLISPEKKNLLIIANPTLRNWREDIRIVTQSEDVFPKKWILGSETNRKIRGIHI